jgi:uncharacterized BrkB/YihY/UPF0761 family membrane protein
VKDMKSFDTHDGVLPELTNGRGSLQQSLVDWGFRIFCALLVLGFGLVSSVLVPLLSLSCSTCQDGIRSPRFVPAMMALAQFAVPAAVIGTAVGILVPRLDRRVAWISGGVLGALLAAVFVLGRVPA